MKKLTLISTLFILTSLLSCEAPVTFTEPQPVDTKNLAEFPNRMLGKYISLTDSSQLTVSKNLIERVKNYDYKFHPSSLDSTKKLVGDTVFDSSTNEKMVVRHVGDSLVTHIHSLDTLFQINHDNVVRKLKGYIFLNTKIGNDGWEVKKLDVNRNQLVVSRIHNKEDIANLKEITAYASSDTVPPYKFKASKKQFKKYLRNDGFNEAEVFIRQK